MARPLPNANQTLQSLYPAMKYSLDLQPDPYELENIYDTADSSVVENLKGRLEALRDCSGDGCREAEDTS